MRIPLYTLLVLLVSISTAQLKSPEEFLGYKLGDRFSRHADVVDYYEHVAANSSMVNIKDYGRTYENRRLLLAYIGTEENLARLETIREDNLRRTGMLSGSPKTDIPIVWLSYNVHGNEASSTEASMATIYELITTERAKEWLKNMIVIIDPCINPDGRDRYSNFYNQYGNKSYNPDPQAAEHLEPWPGGRRNHYLYDLNRDWAWQTQIESQQRLEVYNQWMPHVHVDFHEQGYNSPYYFAPAAEPLHEQITPWQREFQDMIGKNHAKYFDENNWFYFTKQRFDLLYPSYGDSYPMFNGSIGMTYEQAGHGRAGLGIIKEEGDTLTLLDRLTHHKTTGLSTVEITSKNQQRVLTEFTNFFKNGPKGTYKSFVLKSDNQDKMAKLKSWLDSNGIQYGTASNQKGLRGYHYASKSERSFSVEPNDLVVSTSQPKGLMAKVLFEPQTMVSDSMTYDITAWSVPYMFGIDAYATSTVMSVSKKESSNPAKTNSFSENAYAVFFPWTSLKDAEFLAALFKEGFKVRQATTPLRSQGKMYDRGTLVVAKRDNVHISDFGTKLSELANEFGRIGTETKTGYMDNAPDLGSGDIKYLKSPKIAMLAGEGTGLDGVGPTWYFMEQEINYPVTMLWTDNMNWLDLSGYDVLIMQEGNYSTLKKDHLEKITDWVSDGGKLICVGLAMEKFADSDFVSLSKYGSDDEKDLLESRGDSRKEKEQMARYEQGERNYMKKLVPGAIFRVSLDNSHPLAYGYGSEYYTLKTSSDRYGYLGSQNVGIIKSKSDHMSGFAGQYVLEDVAESMVLGVERKGRGTVVYFVDNPLFRSFWQNGKLLFANSLFLVGN